MKWLDWKLREYFVGFQRRPVTFSKYVSTESRGVAQAVRRWLPTAAANVRVRAELVGFLVDKAALGQVFSECFGFPCQSSFHQLHHHNHPGLAQ
jgi:hypothetical protein